MNWPAETLQCASGLFPLTHMKNPGNSLLQRSQKMSGKTITHPQLVTCSVSAAEAHLPAHARFKIYTVFMRQRLSLKYLKWSLCQHNCFSFINIRDLSTIAVDYLHVGKTKDPQCTLLSKPSEEIQLRQFPKDKVQTVSE